MKYNIVIIIIYKLLLFKEDTKWALETRPGFNQRVS